MRHTHLVGVEMIKTDWCTVQQDSDMQDNSISSPSITYGFWGFYDVIIQKTTIQVL
jgi:hypothetical protein